MVMNDSPLVDMALVKAIERTLDDHGISHGALREGAHQFNLNVSDESKVFVKVTRASSVTSERAWTEVAASRHAETTGLSVYKPLVDPVAVLDSSGGTRFVTVFEWIDLCSGPGLLDRARETFRLLTQVSVRDPFSGAERLNLDIYNDRMQARLGNRTDRTSQMLLDVGETECEKARSLVPARPHVWSHGDLHLLNVGWGVNGSPVLLNWESSCLAPVEVDLAQLVRSILTDTPNYSPDERRRVVDMIAESADEALDVDWGLVEVIVRLRAASTASRLVTEDPEHPQLAANIRLIASNERALA